MPHVIGFRRAAFDDMRRQVSWLARRVSPTSAAKWEAGVSASIATLAHDPDRCPRADEADDLGIDLRELLFGRKPHVYRILFTFTDAAVTILRVRHAAQDRVSLDDI